MSSCEQRIFHPETGAIKRPTEELALSHLDSKEKRRAFDRLWNKDKKAQRKDNASRAHGCFIKGTFHR